MQRIGRVLQDDAAFTGWQARRRLEQELQRWVRERLPRVLADRVFVMEVNGSELQLTVASGTLAGKLKLLQSTLLAELKRERQEFNAIRVRVQPGRAVDHRVKNETRPLSKNGRLCLMRLARHLDLSPHATELQAALTRLVRNAQGAADEE